MDQCCTSVVYQCCINPRWGRFVVCKHSPGLRILQLVHFNEFEGRRYQSHQQLLVLHGYHFNNLHIVFSLSPSPRVTNIECSTFSDSYPIGLSQISAAPSSDALSHFHLSFCTLQKGHLDYRSQNSVIFLASCRGLKLKKPRCRKPCH